MASTRPQGTTVATLPDLVQVLLKTPTSTLDSPRSVNRLQTSSNNVGNDTPTLPPCRLVYTIHDSDSESDLDIAVLTTALGSVTIVAPETS